MFVCDRCESSFSPARVAMAVICPRCWGRHGVLAPLTFAPFPPYLPEADDATRDRGQATRDKGDEWDGIAKT